MKNIFINTDNVNKFGDALRVATDPERGQAGLVVCWGQAGRGKSETAKRHYAFNKEGAYLRVWEGWTQTSMLQALCYEVKGTRPRSADACKREIVGAMSGQPRTIYVDEADRLHIKRIEDLRDIHEYTGCAVVLIGEEELQGLLAGRRRIWSRVVQEVEFGPISEMDIATFIFEACGLDVEPDAAAQIRKVSDGDFRLVRNQAILLEEAARARAVECIDAGMVADVAKSRSWRRS